MSARAGAGPRDRFNPVPRLRARPHFPPAARTGGAEAGSSCGGDCCPLTRTASAGGGWRETGRRRSEQLTGQHVDSTGVLSAGIPSSSSSQASRCTRVEEKNTLTPATFAVATESTARRGSALAVPRGGVRLHGEPVGPGGPGGSLNGVPVVRPYERRIAGTAEEIRTRAQGPRCQVGHEARWGDQPAGRDRIRPVLAPIPVQIQRRAP